MCAKMVVWRFGKRVMFCDQEVWSLQAMNTLPTQNSRLALLLAAELVLVE